MTILIVIIISGVLFFGFLLLTYAEAKSGRRMFAGAREVLDKQVEDVAGVVRRADFGAFFFHGARAVFEYLAHALAHGFLFVVRAVERFLTRTVKSLRERDEMLQSSRTFVSAWFSRAKRRLAPKNEELHNQDIKPE